MANIDKKIEKAIEPIVKMYSELETELENEKGAISNTKGTNEITVINIQKIP